MKFIYKKQKSNLRGFTIIEIIVSIFVVSVMIMGIYALINYSLQITNENKYYVQAIAIANQKMEQIRNLSYDEVGTVNGSPSGNILDDEVISQNGTYNIKTTITFFDDPYDDIFKSEDEGGGGDLFWLDYKIVTIKVSWTVNGRNKEIVVSSKVIPPTEENINGFGLIEISVLNASGDAISNANINVKNQAGLSKDYISDQSGKFSLAVLPGFEAYEVTVSKDGYSTDKTFSVSSENPNPVRRNLSVYENRKTKEVFSIDLLSNLKIKTVSANLQNNYKANSSSSEDQFNSKLSSDEDGNIYFVWQDHRNGAFSDIYAQKYNSDFERSWNSNDVQVSVNNNEKTLPDICVSKNNTLYVSWCEAEVGESNCYLKRLNTSNGSSLWTQKVNSNVSNAISAKIFASATSTDTFVVFEDINNDIYFKHYDENGIASSEINISSDSIKKYDEDIFVDSDNNSYIVWTAFNTNFDIYIQKINSNGTILWGNGKKVNKENNSNQYSPAISIDDNKNIYIVWTDERNSTKNIYLQKLNSSGNALFAEDQKVSVNGYSNQYLPSISFDNDNNIYVSWTDERAGTINKDIYSQKISSDMEKWSKDAKININSDISVQEASELTIDKQNNRVIASWTDERNENKDIYFGIVKYPENISNLSIPISIHSSQIIGRQNDESPIFSYDHNYTTNSSGEINLELPWDSSYHIDLQTSSYDVLMSDPSSELEILPGQSKEIILYLKHL